MECNTAQGGMFGFFVLLVTCLADLCMLGKMKSSTFGGLNMIAWKLCSCNKGGMILFLF